MTTHAKAPKKLAKVQRKVMRQHLTRMETLLRADSQRLASEFAASINKMPLLARARVALLAFRGRL